MDVHVTKGHRTPHRAVRGPGPGARRAGHLLPAQSSDPTNLATAAQLFLTSASLVRLLMLVPKTVRWLENLQLILFTD